MVRYNEARIPARYAGARIETFEERREPSLREAKLRFLRLAQKMEPGVRGIGISGPVGTGKTHLVCGLIRDCALVYGLQARFVEFTHLLTEIKRGYDENRSGIDIVQSLVEVPILVIDELGKGLATEWQLGVLDELVSRRYNRGATIFFTTNFPFVARPVPSGARHRDVFGATTLADRIGPRVASRLEEMCDFLRIEADDYRTSTARGAHVG
jgi:DNA replication protein DnaC